MRKKKAVVLLSGGLDSTTVLAIAARKDYECHTLSFDYSQRHQIELQYAEIQSKLWKAESHRVITIDMGYISAHGHNASLVNKGIDIPTERSISEMTEGIPSTYVPARNTIFLAYAASLAEVIKAEKIFIGVNVLDYSGYPDCRPEFIGAYQNMLEFATKQGIEGNSVDIEAPLMYLNKSEIIELGFKIGVDYSMTNSCYNPTVLMQGHVISIPCNECDSCILRAKGFDDQVKVQSKLLKDLNS